MLNRITIKDAEQTISFLAGGDTTLRLVAGCSISPADLGELLMATDIYQRGLTATVMADLMEFDKAVYHQGPNFAHQAIALAKAQGQPLGMAFQVIDEVTEEEAHHPRECELIVIDLVEHVIHTSAGLQIPASGEVRVQTADALTDRSVTYILPKDWKVEAL